jgi:serine/threonine-protein kinase
MAEIWLARQPGLRGFEKIVVIKRMIGALEEDPDQVEMFLTEARLAAGLTHPNVVQIFELGEDQGSFFIVMEFLEGESLSTVWKEGLKREKPLPGPLAAQIIASAAEGLHYAHTRTGQNGEPLCIVHRDVSPQNLIVTCDGAVKLVDFGIAKVASQATSSGKLKGKLAYMSPEQGRGEALDARSDVFALGVVLFEMVTRTRLFPKVEDLQILKHIISGAPMPKAKERRPDVPEALDRIIAKAMAADRDERYASARDLQVALEDFLLKTGRRTTGADIADYMKLLFAERMQQRRNIIDSAKRGELTPSQVPPRMFPNAGDGSNSNPGSADPLAATAVRPSKDSQVSLVFDPPGAKLKVVALGALAVTAAVVLAILGARALGDSTPAAAPDAGASVVEATATLSVDSRPSGARVTFDGAGRGVDPLELPNLAAGPHEVTFTLAGYATEKRSVQLKPGEHLNLVVDLDPLDAPDAGHKPEVKATQPVAAVKMGQLTIDTTPWSTVYLGQRKLGDTPVIKVALPAGRQVLRLVNPEQNINSTIEVDINPNELTVKKLVLQ